MTKYLLLLVPIIFITVIIGVTGITVNKELRVGKCAETYQEYIIEPLICQLILGGHCESTAFNIRKAEASVGICLCNSQTPGNEFAESKDIYSLCERSATFYNSTCYQRLELFKSTASKDELNDSITNIICKNTEFFFPTPFIL